MRCKCGNEIKILLGAKAKCTGCELLTAMTTIVTAKCLKCGSIFQVPISGSEFVVKKTSF